MNFLVPQVKYTKEEINQKLLCLPSIISQGEKYAAEFKKEISESDYQLIIKKIEHAQVLASTNILSESTAYDGYRWKQNNDKIIIEFKSDSESPDIDIDECSIKSSVISGKFYRCPICSNVSIENNQVHIELTVNENWPILIVGGDNVDASSLYILSMVTSELNVSQELSKKFLIHSAMKKSYIAMQTLAFSLLKSKDSLGGLYWYTQIYTQFPEKDDQTAFACICEILFGIEDKGESAKIAENILIDKAKTEVPVAYLYLGYLYMNEIEGFKGDFDLAIKYLEISGVKYRNQKALDTLGRIYLFGIEKEADIKKGYCYLKAAEMEVKVIVDMLKKAKVDDQTINDLINSDVIDVSTLVEDENVRPEQESTENGSKTNIILISIAAALVAASVVVGYGLFSRRRRGRIAAHA